MSFPNRQGRSEWFPPTGVRLDAAVVVLSWLMVAGVAADFRAHVQTDISFAEEGFLTLEHAFFYSMFLLIAAVLGAAAYQRRRRGSDWIDAVPAGYGWAAVGVAMFGLAGVGDFLWHRAFGFEESTQALVSPSHLLLGIGAVLFLAGPFRAALYRTERPGGLDALPALVSGSLALTIVVLLGGYANPLLSASAYPIWGQVRSGQLAALVAFSALLVGAALIVDREFDVPPGGITVLYAHPALASALASGRLELLAPLLVAGLVADAVVQGAGPLRDRPRALRTFGALIPAAFAATFVVAFAATDGLAWTIHAWAGAVVLAGVAGLLVTYVVLPISPRVARGEPA